jgi:hypothetical protein
MVTVVSIDLSLAKRGVTFLAPQKRERSANPTPADSIPRLSLPRWLGWVAIAASPFLLVQAFGLGGVIANFGLVLDLVGFLLFLIFVLASSVIGLTRASVTAPAT